jgi:hypothetical protein
LFIFEVEGKMDRLFVETISSEFYQNCTKKEMGFQKGDGVKFGYSENTCVARVYLKVDSRDDTQELYDQATNIMEELIQIFSQYSSSVTSRVLKDKSCFVTIN